MSFLFLPYCLLCSVYRCFDMKTCSIPLNCVLGQRGSSAEKKKKTEMTQLINFSLTQVTVMEAFRILSIDWGLGSFSKILICGVCKTRKIPRGKKRRTCCCQRPLCDGYLYIETEDQRPTGSSFCRNAPQSNQKTKTLAKNLYLTLKQ